MPKLKVLDTRQTTEEVVIMSWSPKMDLLALGNKKGYVHLHRLSWQKVWQVPLTVKEKPAVPELMTWHPEGLFLVVTSGDTTFVIDVEVGKVVHNHEISFHITATRWCSSQYHHSLNDVLSTHSRQQQIQRLESNLSILFLGTSNGYIYAYTGGFLLGLCIRIAEEPSTPRLIQVDSTKSLESFLFLSDEGAGSQGQTEEDMTITFSNFRNDYFPRMAPIIGPLGLRYILFLKSWATIQGELTNLHEVWARLVDLYLSYMTFGGTKDIDIVRVDFLELLLTGISTVEMEIFLGSVGREKEAKKNINVINSANASITEHIRTIKCSITNLLTELNEIGGFLQQISGYEEASNIIVEIRKASSYLFLAILNIQSLIHNFVELCLHFMNLVMNTIHSFNIQELPDFIEEDAETDKVLEFLHAKIEKDIFKYLFANVKIGYNLENEENESSNSVKKVTGTTQNSTTNPFPNITNLEGGINKYKNFSNFVQRLLQSSPAIGDKGHPLLLDYSESEVTNLITNIVLTINNLTKSLLCIPVLCSVPFEADSFPVIRLSKGDYFLSESEEDEPVHLRRRKPFQLFLEESTAKAYFSSQLTPKKLLMFEVDLGDIKKSLLKCSIFNFSRSIQSSEIFSTNHITVVSYDREDKRNDQQDTGRTIVCQIPYSNVIYGGVVVDVHQLRTKCGGKSNLPLNINVEIPVNIYKPSASCSKYIDYLLPIEGFAPYSLTVSSARKVGALLGEDKRTVLILEMELDFTESTIDDTGDDDDEGSESGEDN